LQEVCKSQAKIGALRQKPNNFNEIGVYDSPTATWKMRRIREDFRQNWISLFQGMTKMDTTVKTPKIYQI